jgi:hypothetical protein
LLFSLLLHFFLHHWTVVITMALSWRLLYLTLLVGLLSSFWVHLL